MIMFNFTFEAAADAVIITMEEIGNSNNAAEIAHVTLAREYPDAMQYLADDYADPGSDEHCAAWDALGCLNFHAKNHLGYYK